MRRESISPNGFNGKGPEITISGTKEEIEALEAMVSGACLVGCNHSGIPLRVDPFQKIDSRPDPATARHWPVVGPDGEHKIKAYWERELIFVKECYQKGGRVPEFRPENPRTNDFGVSLYVQGVGGFGVDEKELEKRYRDLEEEGFEHLRSMRGPDGKYWEIHYLPGTWAAKGNLKGKTINDILRWLAEMGCGSIDMVVQRLALTID